MALERGSDLGPHGQGRIPRRTAPAPWASRLKETKQNGQRQKPGDNPRGRRLLNTPTIADLGISPDQSSKWAAARCCSRTIPIDNDDCNLRGAALVMATNECQRSPRHRSHRRRRARDPDPMMDDCDRRAGDLRMLLENDQTINDHRGEPQCRRSSTWCDRSAGNRRQHRRR